MLRRIIVQNNIFKKLKMKTKLKIALVAHDQRKADMVDWVKFNAQYLSLHELVCTGTTGGLIKNAFSEIGRAHV